MVKDKRSGKARANQCWVCAACGKHTKPGGTRNDFYDVACFIHAVLCRADRGADGKWIPVAKRDLLP